MPKIITGPLLPCAHCGAMPELLRCFGEKPRHAYACPNRNLVKGRKTADSDACPQRRSDYRITENAARAAWNKRQEEGDVMERYCEENGGRIQCPICKLTEPHECLAVQSGWARREEPVIAGGSVQW